MKRGAITHPKMEELADLLAVSKPHAIGMVEMLLHFTDQYAHRGDIGRFSNKQIARRLEWEGDPDRLVECLMSCGGLGACGFIDYHPKHRLVIHDWPDTRPTTRKRRPTAQISRRGRDGRQMTSQTTPNLPKLQGKLPTLKDSRIFQKIRVFLTLPFLSLPFLRYIYLHR